MLDAFTEAEIASALDLTLQEVRQHIAYPSPQLCDEVIEEIHHLHPNTARATLAKIYRCSMLEINRALYSHKTLTNDKLMELWLTTPLEVKHIAHRYNLSTGTVRKRLATLGLEPDTSLEAKVADLMDRHVPATQIAALLDCSLAAVYKYTPNPRVYKRLTEEQWAELLSTDATITELSNRYGVSRAAIYKRKKR